MPQPSKIDRQREHQANERTFLAWLRTSIALIGFGFAIARFGIFLRQVEFAITERQSSVHPVFNSQTLGVCLVVFGIGIIAIAAWRYNQVFWQIERGDYRPNRSVVWIMTAVVILLGLLSLPLLILGQREFKPPSTPSKPNVSRMKPHRGDRRAIYRTLSQIMPR
jgi:putative membrane protein